ncbi:hypothetical protein BBJ28_00022119 [Nothophytophthora sp. Chile5]|nr:hypothetical protein BBJ28_00022119 [Nothophytophthora sp. Chile5]
MSVPFSFFKSPVISMAETPPPPLAGAAAKRQRRDAGSPEDEGELDHLLVALGIPDSGSKRRKRAKQATEEPPQVIELLTPPRSTNRRQSVVDLTVSPPSPREPNPPFLSSQESGDDFSYSPTASPPPFLAFPLSPPAIASPTVHSKEPAARTRTGASQARRLSGQLRDLHAVTARRAPSSPAKRRRKATPVSDQTATAVSLPRGETETETVSSSTQRQQTGSSNAGFSTATAPAQSTADVVAELQMERSLDQSTAGQSIRDALQSHVYNGKPVPFTLAEAFDCRLPRVIRWERRRGGMTNGGASHVSCAIYYEADEFLQLLRLKAYPEVVAAVRYLHTLVPPSARRQGTSKAKAEEEEEEPSKFFVIIEGMDRALIQHKKQQKHRKREESRPTASTPAISFADLHELAFQLFMDVGAHTKFTVDVDATANYVALLTRELVVAASPVSALEEFLEAVPKYNSFRVTHSGATASVCANAWLRMLQVIPGVSEDKAQSLLDHFPTFASLMRAYRDPALSRSQKEDLVSDKLHDSRIQRALSKRIYTVFCEENPETVIS